MRGMGVVYAHAADIELRHERGVRWAENAKESLFRYNQQHDDVEREAMVNPQYT